jgi:hypothetical protein
VPKANNNTPVKITINIQPGKLSPAQQRQWDRAWQRLIAEAKRSEVDNDNHES